MRDEIRTSTNLISQLNALIAELEASGDYEEVFDLVMELWDDRRDEQDKVADFNRLIVVAEEKIHCKEIDLEMLAIEVAVGCAIEYGFCLADPLVNYDNDNENDNLGYQSEEYFDEVQEDDENNHSNRNVVKRGINRKTQSIVFEFLGDMVREHIGLKTLSWKKRYSDVYLTVRKLIEKEIEPDEEPTRGTLWLKERVKKDGEYPDDQIRSVGDKLKETEDNIKEGTLKVDHGTDAMTIVLGTVYKIDGKQMLHNKEVPKDCYRVSIDTSLVDAACIPDVGNNGFKEVKDACLIHAAFVSYMQHLHVPYK
nr:hypothetical protein [Tanacetum cinerariifolium]